MKQVDERTTILDLSTGRAREAPNGADWNPPSHRGDDGIEDLPTIPGFKPQDVFKGDRMTVVSGTKSPGTPIPMVLGLAPGATAPKWTLSTAAVDVATVRTNVGTPVAVHGDRFVGIYGVGQQEWRMTAIDTRTGTREWDVKLHGGGDVLLSSNRVFVVGGDALELYDAATGKLVETIGQRLF